MKRFILGAIALFIFAASGTAQTAKPQNFKWLRNVTQQTVRDYHEGLSAYYENGKWGFINTAGIVVIQPQYDEVKDFSGGYSIVKQDGRWGIMDKSGKFVHQCTYDSISDIESEIALAKIGVDSYYLYLDGKKKMLPKEYTFYPYSEGYARIKSNKTNKWGYVDTKGVFRINPEYDFASDFHGGHALVAKGDKSWQINKKGDKKGTEFVADNNAVLFDNGTGYIKRNNGESNIFMDKTLHRVKEYAEIGDFHDGIAKVKDKKGVVSYINERGETIIRASAFDDAGDFSEGKAWVKKNNKYGYINTEGRLVIDTLFTYASDFHNDLAYVAMGQRQGVIRNAVDNKINPNVEISDIRLVDNSGNGIVEVDEDFQISFKIKNTGNEVLNKASVSITGDETQSGWFSYEQRAIDAGTIRPGETKALSFVGKSNTDLVTEKINVLLRGEGDNLFIQPSFPFDFSAAGINASKPVLETYWVYNLDHSPLTPGQEATLKLTVRNDGTDMAKDVTVNLAWPDGVDYKDKVITIPSIAPNEFEEITTTFTVADNDYENFDREFSIVADIDEFTHRRKDVKYITFQTGRRNMLTNVMTGVAAMQNYAAEPQRPAKRKESELVIGLEQMSEQKSNRFALIFGNEDYNTYKQDATYQPDVEFAERDAETFAKFAEAMMGVKKENIILAKNATLAQMKTNIDKITKLAKTSTGDLELIVYYAGHGQVDGESKDSYLIPVDVSITSPTAGIKLEDFYTTLSGCNAKRTMVFMDACYSGVGRGIIIRPKEVPVKGNLIVMTATSSTQRSMPYQEKSHGLFTYYLLKTLKEAGTGVTIGDLFNEVSETVHTKSILVNNMEQTPELLNGPDIDTDWRNWTF